MVTTKDGPLDTVWSVPYMVSGVCPASLITALHPPALLLRRTVGEGLEHPSHQTVDHHY